MINGICSLSNTQYLQSFGRKSVSSSKSTQTSTFMPSEKEISIFRSLLYYSNPFFQEFERISTIGNEFLHTKNTINIEDLESAHNLKGNCPEERLIYGLTHPRKYYYEGNPYSGIAKETTSSGDSVFVKYTNGERVISFEYNPKKRFAGYTDEINECAKYCIENSGQKTLVASRYLNGVNFVKLINIGSKGKMTIKQYQVTDDTNTKEYKRLMTDVKKHFGDSIQDCNILFA